MRRFFVDPDMLIDGQEIHLEGDEFQHLRVVSRLDVGERVELLDGAGHLGVARILEIGKKSARLKIESKSTLSPQAEPHLHYFVCVPKFQTMDLILQKCAELGVQSLTPVVSERSFMKSVSGDLKKKMPRWQKISKESCKQSGRGYPMELNDPITLSRTLEQLNPESTVFPYEGEAVVPISNFLAQVKSPKSIQVLIGAEGGFSPTEVQVAKARGFVAVSLGPLVLRVETACIATAAVIQYHFGLMR
ncbi:MAG: 16S rRNA (uracil(1498)-N(3))-methyltransferase [Oligoflexia bacterium]|nr:16S rRNA (uracil(1498)-N(3))-methyltransferase [Oligoflexia bacterium]